MSTRSASDPSDVFTTSLPDVDDISLNNGIVDEIEVSWTDVTNSGSYRVQLREDDNDWFDAENVVEESVTSTIFDNLLDGQLYDVRLRSETEDVTGEWIGDSIITVFPAVTDLQTTTIGEASVRLSWTDNADNESGQTVIREQRVGEEFWPEETIAQLDPNVESYTDDDVQPDREYRYKIGSFTNYTSATSEPLIVNTNSLPYSTDRAPAVGWYAEVELPNGATKRPTIVADGADWIPALKAQPQIRLPVPRSPTWEEEGVEGEPLRVWKDGRRLPIEEIRSVERETDRDVIVGIGATDLEDDVSGVEYPEADAHIAATDVIENDLGWLANVDDPVTDRREGVRLFDASSTGPLTNALADDIEDTDPLQVFNNQLRTLSTATFGEAEDANGTGQRRFASEDGNAGTWSGDECIRLAAGDSRTFDFTTDYDIPQGEAEVIFVFAIPDDPTPGIDITINIDGGGTNTLESIDSDILGGTEDRFDLRTFSETLNPSDPLPAGSHDITIAVTEGEDMYLDFAHVRDDRFEYDLDDTEPVDGVVTGWQQFPRAYEVALSTQTSIEQIVAATLTVDMDNTEGQQALGLRNDSTEPFDEGPNTLSHSVEFAEPSQSVQGRITFGRYDTGTESGDFGAAGQVVDSIELEADLVNTPVLIDFVHSGTYLDLLNRIADAGDSIWEYRLNSDTEPVVEWTQPGQRVVDEPTGIADFSGRRTIEGTFQRVIVEGKSRTRDEETFTTNSTFGLLSGLDREPIRPGTETVYDVGDPDSTYERLVDYELDHAEGAIRILEGGSMETSTQYQIDYQWRFQGEYAEPGVEGPRTTRVQAPSASSNRECEQIAVAIVREVSEPLEEIKVTIDASDPTRPLVESITTDQLPFDGPLRNNRVDNEPGRVVISGGSRREVGDVLSNINDRVRTISREV